MLKWTSVLRTEDVLRSQCHNKVVYKQPLSLFVYISDTVSQMIYIYITACSLYNNSWIMVYTHKHTHTALRCDFTLLLCLKCHLSSYTNKKTGLWYTAIQKHIYYTQYYSIAHTHTHITLTWLRSTEGAGSKRLLWFVSRWSGSWRWRRRSATGEEEEEEEEKCNSWPAWIWPAFTPELFQQ